MSKRMICLQSWGDDRFKVGSVYTIAKVVTRNKTEYVIIDLGNEQVEAPHENFAIWDPFASEGNSKAKQFKLEGF